MKRIAVAAAVLVLLMAPTRDALLELVRAYDVDCWLYTRKVVIDETVIPHSHPVLILHTLHLGDDAGLMAALLHEEFHWLEVDRSEDSDAGIAEFEHLYPDAPAGGPEGARDLHSTYMHLMVCDLELQATAALFGREVARATLAANNHYTWIYDKVLNDPAVREITTRHGFVARRCGHPSAGVAGAPARGPAPRPARW